MSNRTDIPFYMKTTHEKQRKHTRGKYYEDKGGGETLYVYFCVGFSTDRPLLSYVQEFRDLRTIDVDGHSFLFYTKTTQKKREKHKWHY